MEFIVVDIETTGISKHTSRITEIAAVKIKNGKIIDEFQTLVNPECHIPSFITRLTGIDNALVQDAPRIQPALQSFLSFAQNHIILAHNASFDYGFLSFFAQRELNQQLTNQRICTRKLASRLLPDLPTKKLSSLCDYFGVNNVQAHRALADVHATHQVFLHMHTILASKGLQDMNQIIRFESLPIAKATQLLNLTN